MRTLILFFSVLLLTACTTASDKDVNASAWSMVSARNSFFTDAGRVTTLYTPEGATKFSVTAPVSSLPFSQVKGTTPYTAPEGFEFVGLQWEGGSSQWSVDVAEIMVGRTPGSMLGENRLHKSSLEVLLDDKWTKVESVSNLGSIGDDGAMWLTVPEGHTVQVRVGFDGQTQTTTVPFDKVGDPDLGVFSTLTPLTDTSGPYQRETACPFWDRKPSWQLDYICGVSNFWEVPYVVDKGWAPSPSSTWLVADVYTQADQAERYDPQRDNIESVPVELVTWSVKFQGKKPVWDLIGESAPDDEDWRRFVWSAKKSESYSLIVQATYSSKLNQKFSYTETVKLSPERDA